MLNISAEGSAHQLAGAGAGTQAQAHAGQSFAAGGMRSRQTAGALLLAVLGGWSAPAHVCNAQPSARRRLVIRRPALTGLCHLFQRRQPSARPAIAAHLMSAAHAHPCLSLRLRGHQSLSGACHCAARDRGKCLARRCSPSWPLCSLLLLLLLPRRPSPSWAWPWPSAARSLAKAAAHVDFGQVGAARAWLAGLLTLPSSHDHKHAPNQGSYLPPR